jgi:PAS domain S-box-containing protein
MVRPLRVLIVEDSPDDAELILLSLRDGGFDTVWKRVETADGLREVLAAEPWDAILSGYTILGFGAPAALKIVREADPDLPFIVVSETVCENAAVAIMRAGANDYICKNDIARLAPAVKREIHECQTRRTKRDADLSAMHLAAIVEASDDAIISAKTLDGILTSWNSAAERLYGWTAPEAIGRNLSLIVPDDKTSELAAMMDRLQAGERVEYFETVRLNKDGRRIDVSLTISPVRDLDGRMVGVSKTARDIRERKRVEEALRCSEARYRELIESLPALVWVYDADGRPLLHNHRWYDYTGQSTADIEDNKWYEALHPDDSAKAVAVWKRCAASGEPYSTEYRIRRTDGEYRWFLAQATPVKGKGGIEKWVGICTNIDERKRAEADLEHATDLLRSKESFARGVLDSMNAHIAVLNIEGVIIAVNKAWSSFVIENPSLSGPAPRTGVGTNYLEVCDECASRKCLDAAKAATGIRQMLSGGSDRFSFEYPCHSPDQKRWFLLSVTKLDHDTEGLVVSHTDITERKRIEEDLRTSDHRFRELADAIPQIVWIAGPDGGLTHLNAKANEYTNIAIDDLTGWSWERVIHPEDLQNAIDLWTETLKTGTPRDCEFRILRGDGQYRWHISRQVPSRNPDGVIVSWYGTSTDIEDLKQSSRALEGSEMRLQHVLASSPAILFTVTLAEGRILGINWISDNLQEMLGYPPSDAYEPEWWPGNIHPEDREGVLTQTGIVLFDQGHSSHEFRFRHREGKYLWTRGELRLIRDAAGRPVEAVGSWSDITERRQLEEQFRQVQKMEAVGQLAGGIAHDFNNLLTIINGYSEILLDTLTRSDPSRELVDEIHKAGIRSAGLTRQLLAFSRQQVLAPQVLDLNNVVTDTEKMLRRLVGEDVQLAIVLAPALWPVRTDPGQIEQVMMNLAVNARDAMPRGGRLTIETRNVELDAEYSRTHADASPGSHVLLSVSDTGSGIPPALKAKIFEPFFTTKGPGKGTGLGLSTVYGIIKQSGGHVTVYSEIGVGTSFKVYLPRAERVIEKVKGQSGIRNLRRGTETILLAEDEEGVRALTRHVLVGCGYTVLEAADGDDAVRVAAGYAGTIHLLITDVVMPGTGGRAMAEQICELYPEMRVLFVSGYTDDAVIRHGVLREGVNFLQKPFSPMMLSFKVREVLDEEL